MALVEATPVIVSDTLITENELGNAVAATPVYIVDGSGVPVDGVAIARGIVSGHLWPGVTQGTGLTQAARQANLTGLQAAINYAATNKKFFELEPGDYQIEGAAGLVIPTGKGHFDWRGSKGSHIKQFSNNAPILTVGDVATSTQTENISIDGFRLSYNTDQAGNTSASALKIGLLRNSIVRNFDIYADYLVGGPDKRAYRGIEIVNAANAFGFFSNTIDSFQVAGAILSLMDMTLVGTGSRFTNGYFTQGVSGTPAALTGPAWNIAGTADQYETVFDTCNLEWVIATDVPLVTLQSCRGMTFMGCHFEGNRINGFDPRVFQMSTSYLNLVGGNQIQDLEVPTSGASGLNPCIFAFYGDGKVQGAGNLVLSWSGASKVLKTLEVANRNRYAAAADKIPTIIDIVTRDVGANNAAFVNYDRVQSNPITEDIITVTNDTTYAVPAHWTIDAIYIKNNTANAITGGIKIGTTSGGIDVVAAQAVAANANLRIADASILIKYFAAATTLYIQDVTAWNSASVDIRIVRRKDW